MYSPNPLKMIVKDKQRDLSLVLDAANSNERITGFTHDFYNYPARFSPLLAREIISEFTTQGDLVLDPFMGGGTTLIEAKLQDRLSVGFDISSLASFLTNVKLNPISVERIDFFGSWLAEAVAKLNCHRNVEIPNEWISKGYLKNLDNKEIWPIRKLIEQFLFELETSDASETEMNFLRCVLLKTSQWALDSKRVIPSVKLFKSRLVENYSLMARGTKEYWDTNTKASAIAINLPAEEIHKNQWAFAKRPKLVLTSPPYPGVHVVYHRWQVFGKKESPAPFWIANSPDGHGLTHYAMGGRAQKGLKDYFNNIRKSFESIREVCDDQTVIIQILAFSNIDWQLPKYLETMQAAGFTESVPLAERIWRSVPNRKWYAQQKGSTQSSKEVILFHRLAEKN